MTVRATHLTFGDFDFNPSPATTVRKHYANVVGFNIPDVIEVEDDWIGFATIDARVCLEVG
jgi:hypothetical protein